MERLDGNDIERVHMDRPLEERLSGLACKPDHGYPSSDPEKVRVADVQANPLNFPWRGATIRSQYRRPPRVSQALPHHPALKGIE